MTPDERLNSVGVPQTGGPVYQTAIVDPDIFFLVSCCAKAAVGGFLLDGNFKDRVIGIEIIS
jgi:hypothetical protein